MMGEQQNLCSPMLHESDLASFNVLGDFNVENHHYLVIRLENPCETLTESHSSLLFANFADSVVGHLNVDRQRCVIVEVEYYPAEASKPNFAVLLTERELQIVQLVAKGYSNKQVAHQLHISEWTVSTHLRRVFAKLGVDSRAAMVYRCALLLNTLNQISRPLSN